MIQPQRSGIEHADRKKLQGLISRDLGPGFWSHILSNFYACTVWAAWPCSIYLPRRCALYIDNTRRGFLSTFV